MSSVASSSFTSSSFGDALHPKSGILSSVGKSGKIRIGVRTIEGKSLPSIHLGLPSGSNRVERIRIHFDLEVSVSVGVRLPDVIRRWNYFGFVDG